VVSDIASSVMANSRRTASRLEMYLTTEHCKGTVIFLAKEFPGVGCRIHFVRVRTADNGSDCGFNRYVDLRGSADVALIVVTTLGSTILYIP